MGGCMICGCIMGKPITGRGVGSSEGGVGTPLRGRCVMGGCLICGCIIGKRIGDPQGDAAGSLEGE